MVSKLQDVAQGISMTEAAAIAKLCPDLHTWPERWQFDEHDIAAGRETVEAFKPFLAHLIERALAAKTIQRHRDNLWLLGGELIRRRYDEPKLKKLHARTAIATLIDPDGGPLIWPRITEADQDSLDATCRKLHQFLNSPRKSAT